MKIPPPRPTPSLVRVGNAKPVTLNPEIMVLASLKIRHSESGSGLTFEEWLKTPKSAQK